jgi:SsrA-binding protein
LNKKKPQPTKPKPTKPKSPSVAASGSKGRPTTNKGGAKGSSSSGPTYKTISENRKARHGYEILEAIECGMILQGSEVKSLRSGKCHIAEYPQATLWNHEPKRPRQLLVRKREMQRFVGKAKEKGLTLVPLRMYFNERGIAKCELALCKGLKLHDKRDKMKKEDARRDIERAVRRRV